MNNIFIATGAALVLGVLVIGLGQNAADKAKASSETACTKIAARFDVALGQKSGVCER